MQVTKHNMFSLGPYSWVYFEPGAPYRVTLYDERDRHATILPVTSQGDMALTVDFIRRSVIVGDKHRLEMR